MPAIGKKVIITCQVCKIEFELLASVLKARKVVKYCSYKCSGIDHRKAETFTDVVCNCCNKIFKKRTNNLTKNNFCSKKCSGLGRRKNSIWSEYYPNKEEKKEYFKKYLENNREKINKLSSDWAKRNRPYRNYIQQLRRAAGELSYKQWKSIIDSSPKCNYCGSVDNLQVDHIYPVSKGGKTESNNLQVLCRKCNQSKSNKIIE
jgi:5-methylcytosine-specific restriction endonuclease McrA